MRDLNEIEAFVSVIRAGGFLPAERMVGIPKSTLSRKVAALEDRLGVSLLKRTTRKLKLTDVGEQYFQGCADALSEIERLEQVTIDSQSKPKGMIRMTAPVEVASDILPPIIHEFQKKYPEIEFEIDLSDRVVDLVEENFDLALRAGGVDNSSSLVAKKVAVGAFGIYASPSFINQNPKIKQPKDLAKLNCIYFNVESGPAHWDLQSSSGQKSRVLIQCKIRVNSLLMAKKLALDGAGYCLLPTFMCGTEVITGELLPVLPQWNAFYGSFHVVTPKKKYVTPRVKLFSDFLIERIKNELK